MDAKDVMTMEALAEGQIKLSTNHKKFIRNCLAGMGRVDAYMDAYNLENRVTATANVSRLMLRNAEVSDELSRLLQESIEEAQQLLSAEAMKSVKAIIRIRDEGGLSDAVKLRAAQDILDRIGVKAPENINVTGHAAIEAVWMRCLRRVPVEEESNDD